MRQLTVLLLLSLLLFASCKKNNHSLSISGLYTETSPVAGRSQLNFISSNLVIKTEAGSAFKDSFSFSISGGKILLTPAWTNQYPAQPFDFEKIDDSTIKTGNLYPGIPEAPGYDMIFKK